MRPIPPMNKWVVRMAWALGGYALKWWLGEREREPASEEDSPRPARRAAPRRRAPPPAEELKMVLVVNDSLKMGKGKIGAQTAHAAVGMVEELEAQGQAALLAQWEACGQPKICLKAKDDAELRALRRGAADAGLPAFQVADAGRTQIPAGSHTVLAIGPAPRSRIDAVTGGLRLL